MNGEGGSDLRSSEAEEIIGGLVNAVERGETLQNAMQTFVNAGYDPQFLFKVSERAYYDGEIPVKEDLLNNDNPKAIENNKDSKKKNKKKLKLFNFEDNKKKLYIILMVVVSIFVLVGALLLGLFWSKLF